MILLDAFAVIALARNEPAADEVAEIMEAADEQKVITALNFAEVADRLIRVLGFSSAYTRSHLRLLQASGLDVLFVDDLIEDAGLLRARHYRRVENDLSMADCIALAVARREQARLATADVALVRTAREEGVEVIPLPDTNGRRP